MLLNEKRSMAFLPQVDGLRFFAVLGVMIQHWVVPDFGNSFILSSIPFGTGVNLFFVISGFLITYILLTRKIEIEESRSTFGKEIRNFFIKRVLRIFPVYYFIILLLCIFVYAEVEPYLGYLLSYSVNWYMIFKNTWLSSGNTALWSLAVEEQFYLVWPFLIFFIPYKKLPLVFTGVIALSFASKIYFMHSNYPMGISSSTFSCFDSFGLGAIAAYLKKNALRPFNATLYKVMLCSSIILYMLFFVNPGILSIEMKILLLNFATSVIFFFLVSIAGNDGFAPGTVLENRVVLYLGRISYGLYLFHAYATTIVWGRYGKYMPVSFGNDADYFIGFFLMTVVFATVSWYLIERPFLKLKNYFQ